MSDPHGYELLDSGSFQKLERFGSVVLSRPCAQAVWQQSLP
jgi:23S rRNA (cytosine1962-C5)-methyltransferase